MPLTASARRQARGAVSGGPRGAACTPVAVRPAWCTLPGGMQPHRAVLRGAAGRRLRKAAPQGCSSDGFLPGGSGRHLPWRGPWPHPALPKPRPSLCLRRRRVSQAWGLARGGAAGAAGGPARPEKLHRARRSLRWLEQEHSHNVSSLQRRQQGCTRVPSVTSAPALRRPSVLGDSPPARLGVHTGDVGRRLALRSLAGCHPQQHVRGSPCPGGLFLLPAQLVLMENGLDFRRSSHGPDSSRRGLHVLGTRRGARVHPACRCGQRAGWARRAPRLSAEG